MIAKYHKDAKILGTDLAAVKSDERFPANCTFIVHDAEDPTWDFEEPFNRPFDYIHLRLVVTCFANPAKVFQQAFDKLRSGGYIEIQDPVFPTKYQNPEGEQGQFARWNKLNMQAAEVAGRPWTNAPKYAQMLRDIGYVDVVEIKHVLPCGDWPEEPDKKFIGDIQRENWIRGLEAITNRSLQRLGWSAEECANLVTTVKVELSTAATNHNFKPYNDVLVVYGRKP
jgi:SAM-dependent methyltransferase